MSKKAPAKKTSAASRSHDAAIAVALVALREVTSEDTFSATPVVTQQDDTLSVAFPSTQPG